MLKNGVKSCRLTCFAKHMESVQSFEEELRTLAQTPLKFGRNGMFCWVLVQLTLGAGPEIR